jgi:hypothetical protein
MKKFLAILAILGVAFLAATVSPALATTGCLSGGVTGGFSWGQMSSPNIPPAGATFTANITAADFHTNTNDHDNGYILFDNVNGTGGVQIQTGLYANNGTQLTFYVEVQAPNLANPGGWTPVGSNDYVYWWTVGSSPVNPVKGTGYQFTLKNLGGGNYQAIDYGYTSPSVHLGTFSNPQTQIVNESVYTANDPACGTWGNYSFQLIQPVGYANTFKNTYFGWGINPYFTHTWSNGDGPIFITINGT